MKTYEMAGVWYDQIRAQLRTLKDMPQKTFVSGFSEGLTTEENVLLVDTIVRLVKSAYELDFPAIKNLNDLPCARVVGCWHTEVVVKFAKILNEVKSEKIAKLSSILVHDLIGPMPFMVSIDPIKNETLH